MVRRRAVQFTLVDGVCRMLRLAAALIGGCLVAVVLAGSTPATADDKSPTNEEIMKKLHGKNGSHKLIDKALKAGTPDWDTVAKHAKIYADLSALLEKNTPEKGDAGSWKKLSQAYAKEARPCPTRPPRRTRSRS